MPLETVQLEKVEVPACMESPTKVLGVRSRLDKVSATGSALDSNKVREDPFEIVANLKERATCDNEQCLKYVLSLETRSSQRIEMHGEATVTYSNDGYGLETMDAGCILKDVVTRIYKDNYQMIFLLSVALCVPPPPPGLLETAHLLS